MSNENLESVIKATGIVKLLNEEVINFSNQRFENIKSDNNQFRNYVNYHSYHKSCVRNLKAFEKIKQLNLHIERLLEENLELKDEIVNLQSSIDSFDDELNNLETDYRSSLETSRSNLIRLEEEVKVLNKPLIIDLELTNFSLPTISLLILLFISLWKNFLTLSNDNQALKQLSQRNK